MPPVIPRRARQVALFSSAQDPFEKREIVVKATIWPVFGAPPRRRESTRPGLSRTVCRVSSDSAGRPR